MKKLHVISHTHWDREWYLTFQQFRLKLVHLVDKLLEILDEDPDFKYFMLDGQTIILDDYLHMRPENEAALRTHIQNGRILIGPWHILPDMFLVSPEAHIRNLLQGAQTARKFGPRMSVGYIPDPFGHPGQTPQILQGFRIETASLWRGVSGGHPAEMWWQAPDGSKVLLAYLRDSYSNGAALPTSHPTLFTEAIAQAGQSLAAHSAVDDHLIMLGTDHMEPSPFTAQAIAHANKSLPDVQVVHSTFPDYIRAVRDQLQATARPLPTLHGELRACDRAPLLPGVLSTRMWIKQRNHTCQQLLEKWTEPFSVFAEHMIDNKTHNLQWRQRPTDAIASNRIAHTAPIIRQAWRRLMENHPHDSICGCSIDQVHDEMRPRFDEVEQIGETLTQQALQALAEAANTRREDALSAVVVVNPHSFETRGPVEVAIQLPADVTDFEVIDEAGRVLPHTFIGASHEEFANVLLPQSALRDTIGAVSEGWIAGSAITRVDVSRDNHIVTLHAVLDDHGQPNIGDWQRAESLIAEYEADPTVTHYHVIAHSPMASTIRIAAPPIPPLGWRTVWLRAVEAPETAPGKAISPWLKPFLPLALKFAQSELGMKLISRLEAARTRKPPFVIENACFKVEASAQDGTLTITDKETGAIYAGLNRFVDGSDAGDEYNTYPLAEETLYAPRVTGIKTRQTDECQSLEISLSLKIPAKLAPNRKARSAAQVTMPLVSTVSLMPNLPRIEIQTEVHNLAEDHRLRVHFPAPFLVNSAAHDGHFEVVNRQVGLPAVDETWVEAPRPEVPQRTFTDISNGNIGLMIANRGLPEVEVIPHPETGETELALTLLRCVGMLSRDDMPVRQGHAGPAMATPGAQMPGKWRFEYAILPHQGGWEEACQQAYAYETGLRAVSAGLHTGKLENTGSFIAHTPAEFMISAVKESEDKNGWVVRGFNRSSEPIELTLKPLRPFSGAMLVNLAEERISDLTPAADGSIRLPVRGHQIVSIRFEDQ
jgi:alpha-mannosidase